MNTSTATTIAPPAAGFSLEPIADFEQRYEEWSALAAASGNVFLTPEWLDSWWQIFGEGHELAIWMARRGDGSALAILPLYRDRRPPRSLRMIGHTQSDLLGPVCAAADRELAAQALRSVLDQEPASVFVGNSLPVAEEWSSRLGGSGQELMPSPTLVIGGRDWEQILESRGKKFRRNARRAERQLGKEREVVWRTATVETVSEDLETLVALHRARWAGESGSFENRWGDLHRLFVPRAADAGWLRLMILELDGAPAAALYNLRFGEVEVSYQSGRDPDLEKLELGMVAHVHAVREAAAAGLAEYRFLRGPEPYKQRFSDRDDSVETVVVPLRLSAKPLPALVRIAPRLPNAARRRLMRLVNGFAPGLAIPFSELFSDEAALALPALLAV
jgi:CelD/BcsL family acetyltransferase involved in cellulose biosynthesis